ncbi:alpha-N-acetylgalactosaminidase-like isoform X1 [Lacerta agilis]|uniref:alpha-N-acetylgalactosaminidase-like isoform X1 n=2 Tax=Lacerta agilis TaxID=80427 RepID=UPI001419A141|nr:alpha-N-acetylgalactosaminidase-like isoform X1 [Lacerta agilis]XP_033023958.1 alpha-N-acetylgalactosaminidase-like isoform X1 [Lacerta agilis]XP_033023959.1 alpha-N-acetylgalactosaminidase-like isoform X1 [Lacerta agilis]
MLHFSLGILLGLAACCASLDNGLLKTPPMGWVPWERFRCNTDCKNDPDNCISEHLIKAMADRLAGDGWLRLGYKYVNLDDCWAANKRDAQGRLQPNPERFPSGIKALADYIHSKGLKFGIYSDLGSETCSGYPGTTLDTIETDAKTFAEWGVDMLKLDGCFSNSSIKAVGYPKMSAALNKTGRPIAFSCSWPAYEGGLPPKVNYTLLGKICNLWRNFGDIEDSWDSLFRIIEWYGDHQDIIQPVAGPGRWNDPDTLIIGDFGLSYEQSKVQVALWAVLAAPFFMSCNLRTISTEARNILQNPLLIYINQDNLGIQGKRIAKSQHLEVWKRPLVNGQFAVAVMNNGTDGAPKPIVTTLGLLGILDCKAGYKVYEVLEKLFMGTYKLNDPLRTKVPPTGVVLFFLRPLC